MTDSDEMKVYRNKSTGDLYLQRNDLDPKRFEVVEILKPGHIQIDVSDVDISKIQFSGLDDDLEYLKSRPYHYNYVARLVFNAMLESKKVIEEPESGFVTAVDMYGVRTRFVRIVTDDEEHWLDLDTKVSVDWETVKSFGKVFVA